MKYKQNKGNIEKEKNPNEIYTETWLKDNGFTFQLKKQTLSFTEWDIFKDGVSDILSIQLDTDNIKARLTQYLLQFEQKKELTELRQLAGR